MDSLTTYAEAPGWLAELAMSNSKPAPSGGVAGPSSRYGEGALLAETVRLSRSPDGTRNDQLNRSAFALGQLVAGGELDQGQAEAALYGVAISKGLTGIETRATIRSGIEAGMREPRSAPQSTDKSRQTKAPVKNSAPEASKETATEEKKDLKDAILIAEAFRNLTEKPRTYYLKPFIWRGNIVLISGARGVGKTNFGLSLAVAVSAGGKIGPWKGEGNTYCLYLDAEMMVTDIQDRLEMLDVPSGIPLYIYSESLAYQLGLPRAHLMNEEWREKLKQLLIDFGIQVLFLDNLASLTPGIDENTKQEWDPVNRWLIELRFLGISVAMVHHAGKSGTQRGTSGREDNIDISIELLKPSDYSPEDGCRFIAHFGKHRIPQKDLHLIGDTEFKLTPREDGRHYCFAHANPKTETKKECLKLFSDGYDQKAICAMAGLSKGYVSKLKKTFIADGLLSKRGELTPKGWSFLHPQKSDEVGNQ